MTRIFRNAVYVLFTIALIFSILANTVPNFVVAEWFEVLAYMAIGTVIWEIFRQLKDHEFGGGRKIKPYGKSH